MKRSLWFLLSLVLLMAAGFSGTARSETPKGRTIARIWRGRTLASKADEYQKYLESTGITRVRATPGNLGVTVLRRADGDKMEFLVLSLWESLDAVKKFAGDDYQKAVLLPRDREYLLDVDPNVLHYETLRDERGK